MLHTMFGGCPRQQLGDLVDTDSHEAGKRQRNRLCHDHMWWSAGSSNLIDLRREESSKVISRGLAWFMITLWWQFEVWTKDPSSHLCAWINYRSPVASQFLLKELPLMFELNLPRLPFTLFQYWYNKYMHARSCETANTTILCDQMNQLY